MVHRLLKNHTKINQAKMKTRRLHRSQTKIDMALRRIRQIPEMSRFYNQLLQGQKFTALIGAGCSIQCGIPNFEKIKKYVILALTRDVFHASPESLPEVETEEFDTVWENTGSELRHTILSNWILERPSHLRAYYPLARLIKAKYFPNLVTYNIDSYLEVALHSIGFDNFLVLINGSTEIEQIRGMMKNEALVKILKTHGDHQQKVYALSEKEIIEFGERCKDVLNTITSHKILIIGYAAEDTDFVRSLSFSPSGDEIWFVNPNPPPKHLRVAMELRRSGNNWIKTDFESFLEDLHYGLHDVLYGFDVGKLQREGYRKRSRGGTEIITLLVKNRLGLHARAVALFVKTANRFASEITIEKDGLETNGKSMMGILMLAANKGSKVTIKAEGNDAQQAIIAIKKLFDDKFGEE